jgi:co-chaperonin GroES (HSP10)
MSDSPARSKHRTVRYIKPLGPRVLVRVLKLEERSSAGLYLPQGVKEEHAQAMYGEVVEVARAVNEEDEQSLGQNVSGVPLGAFVLFPKDGGLPVPWDEALRLIEVKSVWAVVEEVEPEALQ